MNSLLLKDVVLQKLKKHDNEGIKGSRLSVHLPVEQNLLNFILRTLISTSDKLNDFESIVFSELDNDEFVVDVNHKKLEKTIRCKLHEIFYTENSDAILIIEFLEGIRFYETIALKSVLAVKKGWNWFKSILQNNSDELETSKQAIEFSSSQLTINLSELIRQQNLDYLNPLIKWGEFSTRANKLIIDITIKF
jgi:hypothetical protein